MSAKDIRYTIQQFSQRDLEDVQTLLQEYVSGLPSNLALQAFADELTELPGHYAPPLGSLLLARHNSGGLHGCVAIRPIQKTRMCEMKRLYVTPEARGRGIGRRLVTQIIKAASEAEYEAIVLDTLSSMKAAQELYRSLGFHNISPYSASQEPNRIFMRRDLPG